LVRLLDKREIMRACSRLRSLVGVPAPVALAHVIPIGATGALTGRPPMRIERTLHPWDNEDADPRLELRRRAAESQRDLDVEDARQADDLVFEDFRSTDWEDWALPMSGEGNPVPPVTSRR
jgi:hypothetical protein